MVKRSELRSAQEIRIENMADPEYRSAWEKEDRAERWHHDHEGDLDHEYSSCACCCITCEHTNPHWDEAFGRG